MRFVLALLAALIGGIPAAPAAEIPVEVFFQRAKYGQIQLSPDGRNLAIVARLKNRYNLAVIDLQTREAKLVTNFSDADFVQSYWLNDDRLLVTEGDALEASGRARHYGWYAMDRDGSRMKRLRSFGAYVGPATSGGDDAVVRAGAHHG
jgi:hypothetical protein